MIEFDDVSKHYPDGTTAVDHLTLTAPSGQITVLVGPSGCGKTTSLRMVNRTIAVTSGSIRLDGKDISALNPVKLRRGIGYVIQAGGLFPHRTVIDNIGTVPHLLGWSRSKRRAQGMELLERVGLSPELADRYPAQLSGGQQQRVGVARALAADPPVMLMDEPFSAVDPVVRESLQDEFLRLQRELGKTILFVTHDIDEAIKLGDQVAVMREGGRLAQFAPPAELLAEPADDFVANFVGRDRGYRGLSFVSASDLPVHEYPSVTLDSSEEEVRRVSAALPGGAGYVLVLDDRRRPVGWLPVNGRADLDPDRLLDIGSTFTPTQSLRSALDGALVSPTDEAVCVDEQGELVGVISHAEIAGHLSAERRAQAGESHHTGGPHGPGPEEEPPGADRHDGTPHADPTVTS